MKKGLITSILALTFGGLQAQPLPAISETGGDVDNRPAAYRLHGSILVTCMEKRGLNGC